MPDTEAKTAAIYKSAIKAIKAKKLPFLAGGALAFWRYSGHYYSTNDLDLFVKSGDYPKILDLLSNLGFKPEVLDEKWLAKATKDGAEIDLILSSPNGLAPVDDSWMTNGRASELFGEKVKLVGPEELIWTKIYIQNSIRYDGADVNHLILKCDINWKLLLQHLEAHWELLLGALINFRFVYPSKRDKVPAWLMDELSSRLADQLKAPIPKDPVCRGPLISHDRYEIDIKEDGFIT